MKDGYKFTCIRDGVIITIEVEGPDHTWTSLEEHFGDFLKACGFCLPKGSEDD